MNQGEVQVFFETYRDAFNRLNGDAVADLWHTPSGITNSDETAAQLTWWSEDAPMRANHHSLCDVYRHNGYHRADFVIGECITLGANHAFADVAWTLSRADGSVLQAFHTGYNLMRTPGGPKVLLATAYQEEIARMEPHAAQ